MPDIWQAKYRYNHDVGGMSESWTLGEISFAQAIETARNLWGYRRRMLAQDVKLVSISISKLGLPPDVIRVPMTLPQFGQGEWEGRIVESGNIGVMQAGMLVSAKTVSGKTSRRIYRAIPDSWLSSGRMRFSCPWLEEVWEQRHPFAIIGVIENGLLIQRMLNWIYQNTYMCIATDWNVVTTNGKTVRHPTAWQLHPYAEWDVVRPVVRKIGRQYTPFRGCRR